MFVETGQCPVGQCLIGQVVWYEGQLLYVAGPPVNKAGIKSRKRKTIDLRVIAKIENFGEGQGTIMMAENIRIRLDANRMVRIVIFKQ